jgi:hypothetical protein
MTVHILIGDEAFVESLHVAAHQGGIVTWPVPKNAMPGDDVLLFFPHADSFLGHGKIDSKPKLSAFRETHRYRSRIGNIVLLQPPKPLAAVASRFPKWKWPRYPRMYTTPEPDALAREIFVFVVGSQNTLVQDLTEIDQSSRLHSTTKKALIDARLGQGMFRTKVLQAWGNRCSVTGSALGAAIRASHIKPWRESSNNERLDVENGLPLVASLDALFDAGLISFGLSGELLVSPQVNIKEQEIFGIVGLSLRKKPTSKMADYLAHHRETHGFQS